MILKLLLGGAALVAVAAAFLGVTMASAHSRPIRFDVPAGAVLTAAPASITGWFNADLRADPNWTFIRVTDAQGNRVDVGEPALSSNRRQITATLRAGLANGRYLVTWRTWDDVDGRIFGQCYTFFVGQAAADEAVASNYRQDGARDCQSIDIQASNATPAAGGTPAPTPAGGTTTTTTATTDHVDDHDATAAESSSDSDSGGVPAWTLALGVIAGVAVGGLGGRFLAKS